MSKRYWRSDLRRQRVRYALPRRCRLGRKILEQRAGYYTYERKCVVSPHDGLIVEPHNADPSPEIG